MPSDTAVKKILQTPPWGLHYMEVNGQGTRTGTPFIIRSGPIPFYVVSHKEINWYHNFVIISENCETTRICLGDGQWSQENITCHGLYA